jgi:hypothetical protein
MYQPGWQSHCQAGAGGAKVTTTNADRDVHDSPLATKNQILVREKELLALYGLTHQV